MLFCFIWMRYDIINLYYLNFDVQMAILRVHILLKIWSTNFIYLFISCHYSFNFFIIAEFLFIFK
jgi:hypothetical protein